MKIYRGRRTSDGAVVTVIIRGAERPLSPRLDLRNHSRTGLEWGYAGSGPSQLALALCASALQDDARALLVYQRYKFRVVARLDADEWQIDEAAVVREVEAIEAEERKT